MKKALIFHPSLNIYGGAESVLLAMVEALRKINYKVDIYTSGNTCVHLMNNLKSYKTNIKIQFKVIPSFISIKILLSLLINNLFNKKNGYDLIVDTGCLYVPYIKCDIGYIHFPMFYQHIQLSPSIMHRIYGNALNVFSSFANRIIPSNARILIFNSYFTKHVALKITIPYPLLHDCILSSHKLVLYPPVNSKAISRIAMKSSLRRYNSIIVLSRIEPFKRLEDSIKIAKKIVAKKRNIKFFIIGRLINKKYYHKLLRILQYYKLLNNVYIIPNASFRRILNIMLRSKVLLHTTRNEHFGIAIVEGMAAGLVPIVHNSGGPKEYVDRKYRFRNIDEAVEKILDILDEWDFNLANIMMKISWKFDIGIFIKKIIEVLNTIECQK